MKKIDWLLLVILISLIGSLIYITILFMEAYSFAYAYSFRHELFVAFNIKLIFYVIGILIVLAIISIDEDTILIKKMNEFYKEYDKK